MTTQLIPPTCPEGFEYTGEWRCPKVGEYYLSATGSAFRNFQTNQEGMYPILRKKKPDWIPPSFLKPGWVYRISFDEWVWVSVKPTWENSCWKYRGGLRCGLTYAIDTTDWPDVEVKHSLYRCGEGE